MTITLKSGLKVNIYSDNPDCTLHVYDAGIDFDPEVHTTTQINYSEVEEKDLLNLAFYKFDPELKLRGFYDKKDKAAHSKNKMPKTVNVKFVGIDSWNRPVFKDDLGNYYGSVDKLFDYLDTEETVLSSITEKDLTFFGRSFDCEPMGNAVTDKLKIERGPNAIARKILIM